MEQKPVYYSDYLQLDKILNAQAPESAKHGVRADDEMLFIIIHQTYELWFKQMFHEINLVREIFQKETVEENSADIFNAVHRLNRVSEILKILVSQMTVMETMTPLDFLDFRDFLRPASGFQSIQFKIAEAMLGLPFDQRFGQEYYVSQLREEDRKLVKDYEKEDSLFVLIERWLARMPFAKNGWETKDGFWQEYKVAYAKSLQDGETTNLDYFESMFLDGKDYPSDLRLGKDASRSALFIMLYRDYPLLNGPYQLINGLLDIDDLLAQWRYRHMNMVKRMIGKRVGTGGSTGAKYLQKAAQNHYIYKEFADLTSFLLQRNELPKLPQDIVADLSYKH